MARFRISILVVILCLLAFTPLIQGADDIVYVVPVKGAVEHGLKSYLERAFGEAEKKDAAALVLEFNTPGGRIDAAQEIRELIVEAPFPVYAYVKPHALSAGAYLSLACDRLFMAPGGTIGAAEPRTGLAAEETTDEKLLSFWEGEMRTTAELRGRDPDIAAAMVRKEISIPGVVESGKLLTLTTKQAESLGFIDGVFNSRAELLEHLGLEETRVVTEEMSAAEKLARFITNPVVSTLLITIGLAALVLEIFTAGFGVAGSISILSFALFFGGHILAGLAGYEVIVLFLTGVVLLVMEAFVAGFGILGAAGIIALIASILLSAANTGEGLRILIISFFLAAAIIAVSLRFLVKSRWLSSVILSYREDKELGYVGPKQALELLGKEGITLTPLRPSGTAEIEDLRVDVVSDGGFVPVNTLVKVVTIEGPRVVVRQIKKDEKTHGNMSSP